MDFYKKVEIFDVRGHGFDPKPRSILINIGMCIAVSPSCISIMTTCWHKSWFLGYKSYNGFL